jgi:hypothetical protein
MVMHFIMNIYMAIMAPTVTTIMDHTGHHQQIGSLLSHLLKV